MTFALGSRRAVAEITQESGDFGQLRTASLALLSSAAGGDDSGATAALERMREVLGVDTLQAAIRLAADVLAEPTPGLRVVEGGRE